MAASWTMKWCASSTSAAASCARRAAATLAAAATPAAAARTLQSAGALRRRHAAAVLPDVSRLLAVAGIAWKHKDRADDRTHAREDAVLGLTCSE